MNGRKRTVQVKFRVTEEEYALIQEKNEANTYPKYGSIRQNFTLNPLV